MVPKPLTALKKENFVVNPVSNSAISLCASSTEFTYPKLSACLPSSNGSRLKILAMLFLLVPQDSWDLQLRMFGYITYGFPRIFGYVLQVIKYSISVPLDRGGFGGWNLMLTHFIVRIAYVFLFIYFFRGHGNKSCNLIGSLPSQHFPISAHGQR